MMTCESGSICDGGDASCGAGNVKDSRLMT